MNLTADYTQQSLEYIRRYYGVPAYLGQRVYADGEAGEIVGARGQYLLIKLDCRSEAAGPWHPTWHMGYADDDDTVTRFDND